MAVRGGVVVVAGRTPESADRVATRLREDHTVRVAYPATGLDARIDDDCDVVIILDAVGVTPPEPTDGLPQIGLVGDPATVETTVDAVLPPPVDDADVRSMVCRLATRAAFCRTLSATYDDACRQVEDDHQIPTPRRYRAAIDDAMAALSDAEAFELLGRSAERAD
ncbi:MAG: hypothetical protein ACOCYZ_02350 [Halococcoides sp.]